MSKIHINGLLMEEKKVEIKKLKNPKAFKRGTNLNIFLVCISESYFKVHKNIRLNATYYFVTKIPNKRELQQIESNH